MTQNEALEILARASSITDNREALRDFCSEIAQFFADDDVEAVVGLDVSGKFISRSVAYHLSILKKANSRTLAFHAETARKGGVVFSRGGAKQFVSGKRALVVAETLSSSDNTAKLLVEATQAIGGIVVGLGAICNRGVTKPEEIYGPLKIYSVVNIALRGERVS